ncbi:hypothetical protein HMPREF3037_00811, partial [Candidatus Stoquefichus sp. KLE1796]
PPLLRKYLIFIIKILKLKIMKCIYKEKKMSTLRQFKGVLVIGIM